MSDDLENIPTTEKYAKSEMAVQSDTTLQPKNVIVVDWDSPDDPENPRNWSYRRKWTVTSIVSFFLFISPVSSTMIAPAAIYAAAELNIAQSIVVASMISIFVLGYAFGPLVLGPLSEIYGRSRVLQLANLFYLVWNTACGFAQTKEQLIAFRFLAGLGGSVPFPVGGGIIGDVWPPEERGKAIAIYGLAPLFGPVIGPICGAWIAERTTWRWVFWSTSIFDGIIQMVGILFLEETYAPCLLDRKAQRIRKTLDTTKARATTVHTIYEVKGERSWSSILYSALTWPFTLFAHEQIIQLLGVYMAFIYGVFYLFLTTIPTTFEGVYGQKTSIAGLHYLAAGIGLTIASQISARRMDQVYIYLKQKNNNVGEPEFRLPFMVPGTILLPAGLVLSGWAAEKHLHWIAVDFGIAIVSAGMILVYLSIQTYVIDVFALHAASAIAVVSFLRSLAGFGFPLFAPAMYSTLGYGKGNTVLAAVGIIIGCPAPWLFWKYGKRIRSGSNYAQT